MNDHVRSYDSLGAMIADMAKAEAAAIEAMSPAQKALLERDRFFWVRPFPEMDMFIFGKFDGPGFLDEERKLWETEDEDDREPWKDVVAAFDSRKGRGYLTCRAFSPVESEGELGDTHVSCVYEISELAFAEAHLARWHVDKGTKVRSPRLYAELMAFFEAGQEAD